MCKKYHLLLTKINIINIIDTKQQRLPKEGIILYGDGKNQPYGNRSEEEILHLARRCLDFLKGQGVKAAGQESEVDKLSQVFDVEED